jgi:hypothetical protein
MKKDANCFDRLRYYVYIQAVLKRGRLDMQLYAALAPA